MRKAAYGTIFTLFLGLFACSVTLPPPPAERTSRWVNQGWTDDERHWYHHASEGTATFGVPYEWFAALEQPEFTLFSEVGLFADQGYLSRFGFIPSAPSLMDANLGKQYGFQGNLNPTKYSRHDWNPQNLPVGFAVADEWYDPAGDKKWPIPGTGRNAHGLGLTCAACHTGQLEYREHRFLIDGGPGMISMTKFNEALKLVLIYTKVLPGRFDRFAKRVLGNAHNAHNQDALERQFEDFLDKAKTQRAVEDSAEANGVEEGFTRLDALNRIGNEVFQRQMHEDGNIYPTGAPVNYPHIWNTPWFDWVQYNASIQQPMVRNVGEAMGVKALVNLSNPQRTLFDSKIPVHTIHQMETLLAGETSPLDAKQFGGLRSPKWSELPLPPLDGALVAQGRRLYMGDPASGQKPLCVGCHLPPIDTPEIFAEQFWQEPGAGEGHKYLAVPTTAVYKIGTDCKTAFDMAYRTVVAPQFIRIPEKRFVVPAEQTPSECPPPVEARKVPAGYTESNFGVALGDVVGKTRLQWYQMNGITREIEGRYDGFRPNGVRALVGTSPAYKARPLNGIWATAPYLHNGSIPTLYLLFATQQERDADAARFYLGSREFDAKYVGYKYRTKKSVVVGDVTLLDDTQGLFVLDTTISGNRNTGHLYTNDGGPGRIGPKLTHEQRVAIVEFLKSL